MGETFHPKERCRHRRAGSCRARPVPGGAAARLCEHLPPSAGSFPCRGNSSGGFLRVPLVCCAQIFSVWRGNSAGTARARGTKSRELDVKVALSYCVHQPLSAGLLFQREVKVVMDRSKCIKCLGNPLQQASHVKLEPSFLLLVGNC